MNRLIPTALIISALILVGIGVVMIASTGPWAKLATSTTQFQFDHQKNLGIGIVVFVIVCQCKPEWIRKFAPHLFIIGALLLAACYLPIEGHRVNGSARWVKIPFLPRFQASDIGKITSIIGLAYFYARNNNEVKTFIKGFVIPGMLFAIPVLLILFEEDMDTAALLALVGGACMYLIGVRQRYLIPVALLAIACGAFLVSTNENRSKRLAAFKQVEQFHQTDKKTQDINRQQWHALLAFGRGGPTGVGLGNSQEKHGYLPEAHTDFVLAVAAEEFGLTMTLSIVFCFIILGSCGIYIAANSQRMFSRILAAGLTLLILLPALINITVNTAKMPVAGLPLPFISYGGTNLIAMIGSIAVLLTIHRENQVLATEEEPEISASVRPQRL